MALRLDEQELVLIDPSDPNKDRVIAVDQDKLKASYRNGNKISHEALPVQIRVKRYFENSNLGMVGKGASENLATAGNGLRFLATPAVKEGSAKEKMNLAAAYVEFFSRDGNQSLGTYLLSMQLSDASQLTAGSQPNLMEKIEVDGREYQVALRLRREYKDYEVTLKDVQRVDYSGSNMVRDFSSYVRFTDKRTGETLDGRIWMNNPMRYRGETFYQKSYTSAEEVGKDTTGLQVVRNAGWLMPYIACAFATLECFRTSEGRSRVLPHDLIANADWRIRQRRPRAPKVPIFGNQRVWRDVGQLAGCYRYWWSEW